MAPSNEPTQSGCALVTGAGRGIGAACARVLAADGWRVGIHHHTNAEGAEQVVEELRAAGAQAITVGGDLREQEAVDAVFSVLEAEFGPVLVLVNNAGAQVLRTVGAMKDEHWDDVLDVNLRVPFRMTRRAIPRMLRARWGRIINIDEKIFDAFENFGADPSKISRDVSLEELEIDSLDLVELIQILDEELGIAIEHGDLGEVKTVGEALDGVYRVAGATA